jgi:hypothetical protein
VQPAEGEDTKPGRWWLTNHPDHQWGGTCGVCHSRVRAIDLGWFTPPFATEEDSVWACIDCRKHKKSMLTSAAPKVKRDMESRITRPIKFNEERERYLSWLVEERQWLDNWENEGGSK